MHEYTNYTQQTLEVGFRHNQHTIQIQAYRLISYKYHSNQSINQARHHAHIEVVISGFDSVPAKSNHTHARVEVSRQLHLALIYRKLPAVMGLVFSREFLVHYFTDFVGFCPF